MKTGRYKIVKELSNRGLFSIDIGCKYSKFAEISIDIDPSVSPTIIADARYLPIKDNIFERVYLLDIIEHLPKNTEKKTLLEINRILKKNGELIITTPNDYWLFTLTDPAWYLLGHRHYKKELLLKMIKDVGFNIETCFTRGGFWAEIFALWYYLITYPFKFKTPKYIVDKENKEYEKYKKNGFTIFVKAKKMHHKRNNELSKFGVYGILNCVVSSYKVVSGGDTSFIEICRRLDRRGHGICIHTTEAGYEMCKNNGLNADYKIISSHTSDKFGIILSYIIRTIKSILIIPKLEDDTIIYSSSDYLPDTIPALCMKLKNRRLKWVMASHLIAPSPFDISIKHGKKNHCGINDLLFSLSQNFSIYLAKHFADLVLVVNSDMKKYFESKGISSGIIKIMDNGIDVKSISKIQKEGDFYDGCFLGRFHPQKGLFDLIEIWSFVCKKNHDARLAIIGAGTNEWRNKLKTEIIEKKLQNNIDILGFLDEENKYKIMKSSKVFLFPSTYESWGIVACEAMACGLPVVAYDLSIFKEIYPKGMITVPVGDTMTFAKVVLDLMENNEQYYNLKNEALEMASKYDWDLTTKSVLKHIEDLFD